jgi:hypothetical protein
MAKTSDYQTHLFSYQHGGAEWTFEIKARDAQEARERVKTLSLARYDGELIAKIPNSLGPLTRLAVLLRNVCTPKLR